LAGYIAIIISNAFVDVDNVKGFETELQANMASSNWQQKVDALTAISQSIQSKKVGGLMSAPLIVYLRTQTSNFKITNVSVQKAVIQLVTVAAENIGL
jgi:hypothetical protein